MNARYDFLFDLRCTLLSVDESAIVKYLYQIAIIIYTYSLQVFSCIIYTINHCVAIFRPMVEGAALWCRLTIGEIGSARR